MRARLITGPSDCSGFDRRQAAQIQLTDGFNIPPGRRRSCATRTAPFAAGPCYSVFLTYKGGDNSDISRESSPSPAGFFITILCDLQPFTSATPERSV